MIEVIDRVPTYPGRVKLVPVPGQENTYDMVRADEPIEDGTPMNKVLFDSIRNDFSELNQSVADLESPLFHATVTNNWTASGIYFYQDIPVDGILETDTPIVGIAPGSDNAANVQYSNAISSVFRVTTSANNIRVWVRSKPAIAFPIQIKAVR